MQGPDYRLLMIRLRPGSWFPGDPGLGTYVDRLWTGLGEIISDLDRWEITGDIQVEARAFRLCLLVASPDADSPGQRPSLPLTQGMTKQQRQQQLTLMSTKDLRKLAAEIVGGRFPSASNRNLCIDEILNKEYRVANPKDGGGEIPDSDPDNEDDLENNTVVQLKAIAKAQDIVIARGARKADIVNVIKAAQEAARAKRRRTAVDDAAAQRASNAPPRGFNADMITPYFHVLAAHVWEQMISLAALGRHISHNVTHKHCSCSPCELANNRYNRTYFQRSCRRLTGLEKENLLTSWRCKVNPTDIERTTGTCGHCGKAFTRAGMLKQHIAKCGQASKTNTLSFSKVKV